MLTLWRVIRNFNGKGSLKANFFYRKVQTKTGISRGVGGSIQKTLCGRSVDLFGNNTCAIYFEYLVFFMVILQMNARNKTEINDVSIWTKICTDRVKMHVHTVWIVPTLKMMFGVNVVLVADI